ncbi:MAG: nucleotidyltransferase domain-containing protein [Tannerella sp.]|jgi:predicted nucleotidyltransferase|nr:nucleotidyltransferase domain-containing protein [Tannerella sp.]
MDKNDAIRLSKNYVEKVKQNHIEVIDAWLFGSYAKGNFNDDSDIDIALVLPENILSFDNDVKLMALRKGDETMIETHTYSQHDFTTNTPVIEQIKQFGFRL